MLRGVVKTQRRLLHASCVRCKPKESNKQAMRNLALAVKKEEEEKKEAKTAKPLVPEDSPVDEFSDNYKRLQDYYDSISYMSTDDLMIQQNLDEGKQFKSFPSEHYLDRKKLLKSLPDEIDIFNTPLPKIEKIYKDLGKLDKDKSVHLKYYKRYLNNYSDPVIQLLQEFNGISEKFKLLRRNELDNLSLNPGSYLYKENLFSLPYNVVGFDKSISGFPLRTGKHRLSDICYPQEFIQDLQMYKKNIKLHKKDLDFVEFNENSTSINPHNLITPHDSINKSPLENHNSKFDKVINLIYNELEVPKNFILVDNLNDFKILKFRFMNKFNSILETEINTLKSSLQKEIEMILSSNNKANNLLLFNHQFFKTNSFKLCDILKDDNAKSNSMLIISYNIKELNLIPYNFLVNKSVRSHRRLYNHIFKLFLINLKDQIETLSRIKYSNKKLVFINNLNIKISNIIKFKLLNLLGSINDLKSIDHSDAVIFKPHNGNNFKRLYNYKMVPLSKDHKPNYKAKLIDLEVLLQGFS